MTDPKRFASRYPFALDAFQVEAIDALREAGGDQDADDHEHDHRDDHPQAVAAP